MNLTNQPVQPKTGLGGKKHKATYAERKHMNVVAQMRCIITGRYNPILHHCFCDRQTRYAGKRAPHFDVIPLHQSIHQGLLNANPSHVAIHVNKRMWVELHGKDWEYIPAVYKEIYGDENITHAGIEAYWNDRR